MRACTLLPLPPADPPNLPLVCCLLCVVQKRISLSLAGAIRNELTHTNTHAHTRDSLTHTRTAGTHIQPSPVHTSQRHTHTHTEAGRQTRRDDAGCDSDAADPLNNNNNGSHADFDWSTTSATENPNYQPEALQKRTLQKTNGLQKCCMCSVQGKL